MNKIKPSLPNKIFHNIGAWFTLLLSFIVLFGFYGKILKHPNQIYFSEDGDGLQSYYTTIYHIKYDSTYSHFQGMNYPYGEHVLFTNCQPVISNTLKFISRNIVDVSDYAVGVMNLLMLLSIVIAAVFLFLILMEFNMHWVYSMFIAIGLAFLSPQLNRFTCHYSLSYVFTIPVVIYLLIRFYKNPSWKKSLITGLFLLLMAAFHMYNLAFSAFILGIFWLVQLFSDKNYRKWKFFLVNIFLQIILPYLVLNIWLYLTDNIHDRTMSPWGYMVYKAGWEGIFLQHQTLHSHFLKSFIPLQNIDWEGWSYIGHVATYCYLILFTFVGSIVFYNLDYFGIFLHVFLIGVVIHILFIKRKNILKFTDNKLLNILLATGILALLFSFTWPFNFYPHWLNYAGPLKQFRGVARFAWIFYYTVNIGAFYLIYNLKFLGKLLRIALMIFCVYILYQDAYVNNRFLPRSIFNHLPELSDAKNKSDFNILTKNLDVKKYQSIIPIPYFDVGSENIWLEPKCNSHFNSFIISLKTGLPINAVLMSRTSISQAYNNASMIEEPYHPLKIVKDFKSDKPFLLLVTECDLISPYERNLISKAKLISRGKLFSLYEFKKEVLLHIADSLYSNVATEMSKHKLYEEDNIFSTDAVVRYVYRDFDTHYNKEAYAGKGCFTGKMPEYNTIFEGTLPNAEPDSTYVLSFWFGKIHHDTYTRSNLEVAFWDSLGNLEHSDWIDAQRIFKIIDGDWALAEMQFKLKYRSDKMKVTLWNDYLLKTDTLFIDNLLIRPENTSVYKLIDNKTIFKNNRFYFK